MYRTTFKFNNSKRTSSKDNYKHDSKFEASVANDLLKKQKNGEIRSFISQKTLHFYVNGLHICDYKVDFEVEHNDGSIEYIEAKGFETMLWIIKWRLLEALHEEISPGSTITVIKQQR